MAEEYVPDDLRLYRHLRTHAAMYVLPANYDTVASFIVGYDTARDSLTGFQEWLIAKHDGPSNLHWVAMVPYIAFPDADDPFEARNASPESEQHALNTLFDLIEEFIAVRDPVRGGLRRVFFEYEKWLRRQSWYDPGSPEWLE